MEAEEATSSTPRGSVISSVVVAEKKKPERPAETSRSRYMEKVKELDLEELECRQELAKALGLERVSHEDLGRHQCVDWLKAHETHFSRAKMMETADLTGIPTKSVMCPINYRPLKSLGSLGLVMEPPKHRTSIARIRVATSAQLRVVDKLMDPREMELPDAAYEGARLANDPRYGKPCGSSVHVQSGRIDGYLALVLLTHGELVSFHRLMKYGEPLSMGRAHSSIDTYSYKCAAGLKTLLVQYLLMQNRHLTGEEKSPKTRDEWRKVNGGMPLLTDLCLAMRSDPMGMIRGLEEVVTCIYGPAVTFTFPDPLVTAYRYSVTHVSLISILDGTTLNWCQQEVLRAQMSNTVLFGKVKDPELVIYSFRGQLQCRMGGKREGPIETYPKFWNLNPLTANGQEILRIPAWKKSFELVKRELEAILEKEVLPASIPEFPTVRRMTLGMNSSLVVPSLFARAANEEQQKEFIDGWDPLFIGYSAAIYFHTSDAKINSWTTQAKKMRGSMPPKFEVRDALRTLERAGLENKLPVWDDGRMIVNEGHIALKGDEIVFATRRYRAPYGLEQVEMRQEGKELDAAGPLYVALTEYKKTGPATPSPLSVDTPGDKRSGPVEDRFRRILERREAESGEESMDETLSEAGEDMEVENTPEQKPSEEEFTTQELLKDLSGENWADTPTPPLTSSPRKNLELPLTSDNPNMGMIFLSAERREKNTFEGNRDAFLGTLDEDAWRKILSDFNREVEDDTTLDDFKEELWDTVVKFGEPVLMGTGLEEKAGGELLSKMVELRKAS